MTFLLVGSDSRAHVAAGALPGGRSDAIMIARFSGDRKHAQLISIPRDSWVNIPGHGKNKINASYAFGGPSLLIQTVEQLTDVRIDHYVAIDFDGLIQVTDDLGGVDVQVAETTTHDGVTFPAGVNHLDGTEVRQYLQQRKNLPGGDFDRVRRQQQYLRAMFAKLFSADTFSDPGRLDGALRTVTSAVAIDDTLGNGALLSLAYSLRNVTPDDVDFFTAPVLGTGMEGAGQRRLPRPGGGRPHVVLPAHRLAEPERRRVQRPGAARRPPLTERPAAGLTGRSTSGWPCGSAGRPAPRGCARPLRAAAPSAPGGPGAGRRRRGRRRRRPRRRAPRPTPPGTSRPPPSCWHPRRPAATTLDTADRPTAAVA